MGHNTIMANVKRAGRLLAAGPASTRKLSAKRSLSVAGRAFPVDVIPERQEARASILHAIGLSEAAAALMVATYTAKSAAISAEPAQLRFADSGALNTEINEVELTSAASTKTIKVLTGDIGRALIDTDGDGDVGVNFVVDSRLGTTSQGSDTGAVVLTVTGLWPVTRKWILSEGSNRLELPKNYVFTQNESFILSRTSQGDGAVSVLFVGDMSGLPKLSYGTDAKFLPHVEARVRKAHRA